MHFNRNPQINEVKNVISAFKSEFMHQSDRRDAAVLVPLVEKEDGLHILFQVRNASISQGGEVSFPGGRVEEGEEPEEAAARETVEELLLEEDQVEVLAPLFQSVGPGSRNIFSYLGMIHNYEGSYSKGEVERVFTVPLSYFLSNEPKLYPVTYKPQFTEDFPFHLIQGGKDYRWDGPVRNVCFYEVGGEVIWGMTAEILHETIKKMTRA